MATATPTLQRIGDLGAFTAAMHAIDAVRTAGIELTHAVAQEAELLGPSRWRAERHQALDGHGKPPHPGQGVHLHGR